jgi:ATP phosphoribosyltransferase regulatory subunit
VLLRGGRYDEIGAVFGRNRPAVGCSLDLKSLAALLPASQRRGAIRAPWTESASLRAAVRHWRARGETVVCALPQDSLEGQEFVCDRALVELEGRWQLQAI